MDFPRWCERIGSFLEGGDQFKPESPLDVYAALPPAWVGTTVEEKKRIVEIVDKHDGWTVACVKELHAEVRIPIADMQSIQLGVATAKRFPGHLELVQPPAEAQKVAPEVAAVVAARKPVTDGLVN